ncbi:hypothetical protein NP493_570g04000 [Ridgeia piscesae]|uniref:Uncharacterized protein n=1 Tax=Ridgeia piscesae TaxID=27915 RepID=A0AAD9KV41_RIDPI|nr:hypothetical protein NP493_570g04000 [Ridgeia piscesae]
MASACDSTVTTRREQMKKTAIGTHPGNFHCDGALACFMLTLLPEYKDAAIIRLHVYSAISALRLAKE